MKKILFLLAFPISLFGQIYTSNPGITAPAFTSAFGDPVVGVQTPLLQFDFVYGINSQIGTSSATGTGATVDVDQLRLRLQSGTDATTGTASFISIKPARYRAGQGITARFTAVFDTAQTGNVQIVGMGNASDGYFFGYNGTTFGILHRNSATGVLSNDWIAQTTWNKDKCDGSGGSGFTLNKVKGNVFMIRYPYLGYGTINFFVLNPATGAWVHCHTIQYPNSTQTVQLSNPSLNFYAQSANTGANTTNTIVYVASVGVFLNGERLFLGPQYGTDTIKTNISTQTAILTLKNCTTYNGQVNRGMIRLRSMSVSYDGGNGNAIIRVIKNTTLGGSSPVYTPINGTTADNGTTITTGNSIASRDATASTVSGGIIVFNTTTARNTGYQIDLTPYDIFIEPGSILTFSAAAGAAGSVQIAVNWNEDI